MTTLPVPFSGKFEAVPEGTHPAACYRIIDLGTQQSTFGGNVTTKRQVMLGFEVFCEERRSDGRPFMISKTYTMSVHDKAALRVDLEAWHGKKFSPADFGPNGFRLASVIGEPCLLTIMHEHKNGEIYSKISSITCPPRGMMIGAPEGETLLLWLEPNQFDASAFDRLSDRLKEKIGRSPEYGQVIRLSSQATPQVAQMPNFNDNIPY